MMNKVWIIATRELKSFFDSLMAYVLLILFLGLSGFFTWLFGRDVFFVGQASLSVFFEVGYWTLFFFIPAITMGMISEEKRSGTFEILVTRSVTDWQIILGKFLAAWLLVFIAILLTMPYYITVSQIGNIDHGATIGGYTGLLLIGAAYCGIGIFASSLTENQVIAFLVTLLTGLLFQIVFVVLYSQLSGTGAQLFYFLSFNTHYESLSRGVADSRNFIYLLSIAFAGLYGARAVLSVRNLKSRDHDQ